MLHLLLADDHTLFRESVAAELRRNASFSSVLEAGDATSAVRLFEEHHPDVVLLSVHLPAQGAFSSADRIRSLDRSARIVFLADRPCEPDITRALAVPADGLLLKQDSLSDFVTALMRVAQGERVFSTALLPRLTVVDGQLVLHTPCSSAVAGLTLRERLLLAHLSHGASLKEAAAAMSISYKTADNQKASLMHKLNIHDRVELARFAIREGVISL
ncbi:MAG TPA: response regulator transcription factor [Phycisphaerae bacterium]|nr:response regulator transcription factor [Phycisphaerae bacterium]